MSGQFPAIPRVLRTDAAVDPDGVVVLLRHARVTAEAVLRPHRLLDLRTRRGCSEPWLAGAVATDEGLAFGTHHAGSAEDPGVEAAGLGQHQHVLTTQTQRLRPGRSSTVGGAPTIFFSSSVALTKPGSVRQARR